MAKVTAIRMAETIDNSAGIGRGKLADGTLAIRCESQSMTEPVTTVHTWKANGARLAHGSMMYATLDEAIGKPAESGNGGQWSVYVGMGNPLHRLDRRGRARNQR